GTASTTNGQRIRLGVRVSIGEASRPKNTSTHTRVTYAAVTTTVTRPATSTVQAAQLATGPPSRAAVSAAPSTASLEKKPANGGTPASAASPTVMVANA